jgi:N-acetylmuramoyl-L-alanine amidase
MKTPIDTDREITEIFVHCSATAPGWLKDDLIKQRREITRWHVEERGWAGIGYNTLIGRRGEYALGRDLDGDGNSYEEVGAHAYGHNKNSVAICLLGGRGSNERDQFRDHFTEAQARSLANEISRLKARWPNARVRGHNEVAAKACPGFNVQDWMRSYYALHISRMADAFPAHRSIDDQGGVLARIIRAIQAVFAGGGK